MVEPFDEDEIRANKSIALAIDCGAFISAAIEVKPLIYCQGLDLSPSNNRTNVSAALNVNGKGVELGKPASFYYELLCHRLHQITVADHRMRSPKVYRNAYSAISSTHVYNLLFIVRCC